MHASLIGRPLRLPQLEPVHHQIRLVSRSLVDFSTPSRSRPTCARLFATKLTQFLPVFFYRPAQILLVHVRPIPFLSVNIRLSR